MEIINYNTKKISVAIPNGKRADLPVTSFLLIRANVDGKDIVRPYTPTSLEGESLESFDLLIKKYDNGALTPHLFSLKPGDKISVKGPIEKYPLEDRLDSREDRISHICMIAGGTGITPMLQIIKHVLSLEYREAPCSLRLIFANQSERIYY